MARNVRPKQPPTSLHPSSIGSGGGSGGATALPTSDPCVEASIGVPPRASVGALALSPVALQPADAARYIGISRPTLYRRLKAGEIPAKKCGNTTLILRRDLDSWLASLPAWEGER